MINRERLALPVGGVERDLVILETRRLTRDGDGTLHRREHITGTGFRFMHGEYLGEVLSERGGYLPGSEGGCFTATGDSIEMGIVRVIEYKTGESADFLGVVDRSDSVENIISSAMCRFEKQHPDMNTDGVIMTKNPSILPYCMHAYTGLFHGFGLAYHVNVSARAPSHSQRHELMSALACLLPLTGSGGLYPGGFCISPLGSYIKYQTNEGAERYHPARGAPYIVSVKKSELKTEPARTESRLHVACFDAPFLTSGLALTFGITQILAAMLERGISPTCGLAARRPVDAFRRWSVDPSVRVPLRGGGRADALEIAASFMESLRGLRKRYRLPDSYELLSEKMERGITALVHGDEEFLAHNFQYHLKKLIYSNELDAWGISMERFNRVMPAIMKASRVLNMDFFEISRIEAASAKRLLGGAVAGEDEVGGFKRYLSRNRISISELLSCTKLLSKLITIELHLGRIFPDPSPIHDIDRELWGSFKDGMEPAAAKTRADARARLIREIMAFGNDPEEYLVDWAQVSCPASHNPDHCYTEVVVMEDPATPSVTPVRRIDRTRKADNEPAVSLPALW